MTYFIIVFIIALILSLLLPPIIDSILLRKKRPYLSFTLGSLSVILAAAVLKALDFAPQRIDALARGLSGMLFGVLVVLIGIFYYASSLIITELATRKARGSGELKIPRYRPWLSMGLAVVILVVVNLLLVMLGVMPYGPFDFYGKLLSSLGVLKLFVDQRWIIPGLIGLVFLLDIAGIYSSYRKDS